MKCVNQALLQVKSSGEELLKALPADRACDVKCCCQDKRLHEDSQRFLQYVGLSGVIDFRELPNTTSEEIQ